MKPGNVFRSASVALIAILVLGTSACSGWRNRTDYRAAQSVKPLEVPPDLDSPDNSSAISIPDARGSADDTGAMDAPIAMDDSTVDAATAAEIAPLILADSPSSAFRRVRLALERAVVGTLAGDNADEGKLRLTQEVASAERPGFFKRLFTRDKTRTIERVIRIVASGEGSEVRIETANGAPAKDSYSARVMQALKARLGE